MRHFLWVIGILLGVNVQAQEICVKDKVCYSVSVAESEEDLEKGLMFVKSMPHDEGMLFDMRMQDKVVMWMKNTYIPLDMLFMDCQGNIVDIYEQAEPLSLSYIVPNSKVKICYVLEINGGEVSLHEIRIGDEIKSM